MWYGEDVTEKAEKDGAVEGKLDCGKSICCSRLDIRLGRPRVGRD